MSSNVGLSTPRGSGTSGYVQRNLSLLKPRAAGAGQPYSLSKDTAPKQRKPDQNILEHDRLREIEVKVLELRDKLEDDEETELDDDAIDERCEKLRKELIEEMERGKSRGRKAGGSRLKSYQVHEMAEAKERESERLRRALGLKGDELGEDGEHPMARQERRRQQKELEESRRDLRREQDEDEEEKR